MKKIIMLTAMLLAASSSMFAQESKVIKKIKVPAAVIAALHKKYPAAAKVSWEKEKGNYEANWGGKSREDNSVQFTPAGEFIEMVKAMPVKDLPGPVFTYVKEHYKGSKITEAGKVTDAAGKTTYEAEIKGKDVIFDENGNFVTAEK